MYLCGQSLPFPGLSMSILEKVIGIQQGPKFGLSDIHSEAERYRPNLALERRVEV